MRYMGKSGAYPDTTIFDVINDIRDEEKIEKRALYYAKHPVKDVIKPRTLGSTCDRGILPHRLRVTQGQTKWYPEHSAIGTTYQAVCSLCGATDEWILGVNYKEDTGGVR
jgi:hypothetical protein